MVEFAQDDDRLREERKKAKKNKDKYIGVSSDSVGGFRYSEYSTVISSWHIATLAWFCGYAIINTCSLKNI